VKIGVSIPDELVVFADEEAVRRRTSRSGLLAQLLQAECVREQTRRYLDRYGWGVVDDEPAWREYQRRRMAEEYSDDEWWGAAAPGRGLVAPSRQASSCGRRADRQGEGASARSFLVVLLARLTPALTRRKLDKSRVA
jgi:hypothetical protein